MSKQADDQEEAPPKYCGIVRPIADFDPYPIGHWQEVHDVIAEAIVEAGYIPRLVSESEASGVIQGDIVTNLYNDDIVVCDVSGRNPNVMFELGMRVAFEKPVVIVKDDRTPFSFDIAPIKHLPYPFTLRISGMRSFRSDLVDKIRGTIAATSVAGYRGYLQQFGNIKATEIEDQTVTVSQMAEELREMQRMMHGLQSSMTTLVYDSAVRSVEPRYRNTAAAVETSNAATSAIAAMASGRLRADGLRYDPAVVDAARRSSMGVAEALVEGERHRRRKLRGEE